MKNIVAILGELEKFKELVGSGQNVSDVYTQVMEWFDQHYKLDFPIGVKAQMLTLRGRAEANNGMMLNAEDSFSVALSRAKELSDKEVLQSTVGYYLNFLMRIQDWKRYKELVDMAIGQELYMNNLFEKYVIKFHQGVSEKNIGNQRKALNCFYECKDLYTEIIKQGIKNPNYNLQPASLDNNIAECHVELGEYKEADRVFDNAIASFPETSSLLIKGGIIKDSAKVLILMEKYDQAEKRLDIVCNMFEFDGLADDKLYSQVMTMKTNLPMLKRNRISKVYKDTLLGLIIAMNK